MIINIADIAKRHGSDSMEIHFEEPIPELIDHGDGYIFDRSVVFDGQLTNNSGILKLEGILKASYTTNCSRCLSPIAGIVEVNVKEDFVEGERTDTVDADAYTFSGRTIDIGKALVDNIILELPVKEVCSTDCKGVCDTCGVNLNELQCDCGKQQFNPKLEALKNYKF